MLKLTYKQAIDLHREMWNIIADKEGAGIDISKEAAIRLMNKDVSEHYIIHDCFCCHYASLETELKEDPCKYCPLDFSVLQTGKGRCTDTLSYYNLWASELDLNKKSELARSIANLPEVHIV